MTIQHLQSSFTLINLLFRKPNAQQQRRLLNALMLVAQNPHSARFHHQTQWELHRVAKPALRERPREMSMSYNDHVGRSAVFHVRRVQSADFGDQRVDARCDLGC